MKVLRVNMMDKEDYNKEITMRKKLQFVNVGWKYTIERIEESGSKVFDIHFPSIRFEADDLKGRTRWLDNEWINLALSEFEKEKGFRPENIKDEYVDRVY
jgi:hypothetical protein